MTKTQTPNCPSCGAKMKRRTSRRGPFYGCSTFPRCRATLDIPKAAGGQAKVKRLTTPSPMQAEVFRFLLEEDGSAFVNAVAGSGKTTTIVEGFLRYKAAHPRAKVTFLAFNRSIARELSDRGVPASTLHSFGLAALREAAGKGGVQIDGDKTGAILDDLAPGKERRQDRAIAAKLVGLAKGYLAETGDEIQRIAEHHAVDGVEPQHVELALRAMDRAKDQINLVDFDDMIWLPVVLGLRPKAQDLLLVDEAQDLNAAQIGLLELAANGTGRVIAVGDPRQAIYGFRGASSDAVERVKARFDMIELPLSVTYRCPTSVVAIAQEIVPEIEAVEGAPAGDVEEDVADHRLFSEARDGDLVLCRTNAPLVSACLAMLRNGTKARIQGRDLGAQLAAMVRRLKADSVADLIGKVDAWRSKEVQKLMAKERPSEAAIQLVNDKAETIEAFADSAATVEEVVQRIERTFADTGAGVVFSSVHRAKGLEAEVVWIMEPDKMPHPMAQQPWEQEQEWNLLYVAVTRAKRKLLVLEGELACGADRYEG